MTNFLCLVVFGFFLPLFLLILFRSEFFHLNSFLCLKVLAVSRAIFLPSLVKEKEVLGSPLINFLFRRVLNWRSSLRESGHWGYFEKLKVSGDKVKHSLTNLSKSHFSLLEATEYRANRIKRDFFI